MNDTFHLITEGIRQIFAEAEHMELTADTTLAELPGWDSMAAVNLQSFLEYEFGVTVSLDRLDDATTLNELMDCIEGLPAVSVNR